MYPTMKKTHLTMPFIFLNVIKILGFYIKNSNKSFFLIENILLKLQIPLQIHSF